MSTSEGTHELELREWRGGEHYFDGPHDAFCFVCGSPEDLIGCQTCDNCYHVGCMEPSIEGDVPGFWFCPHCVARDWDKPPALCPDKRPCGDERAREGVETETRNPEIAPHQKPPIQETNSPPDKTQQQPSQSKTTTPSPNPPKQINYSTPPSISPVQLPNKRKPSTDLPQIREQNPLHKKRKSKYSPFTASIEKALGVITNELEGVSRYVRTIEELRERIGVLEQEVRVRDGRLELLGGKGR